MKKVIMALTLALALAALMTACGSTTKDTSEVPEQASEQVTTAATAEQVTTAEEAVYSREILIGFIPEIVLAPGENPVPLGVKVPDSVMSRIEGPKPLFLYSHPEYWDEIYRLEGSDVGYVVKVGNYYMDITFQGGFGPAWKYTSYSSGKLYGVTPNYFLFSLPSGIYAIEQRSVDQGKTHWAEDLPKEELDFIQRVDPEEPVDLDVSRNVQINDFSKEFVELDIRDGEVDVRFVDGFTSAKPTTTVGVTSPLWHRFSDGRRFFVQTKEDGSSEAVFIGGIEGNMQVICIPFKGNFLEADSRGIFYQRGEKKLFKSFYPMKINGEELFPEMPMELMKCGVEFLWERQSNGFQHSTPLEGEAPF